MAVGEEPGLEDGPVRSANCRRGSTPCARKCFAKVWSGVPLAVRLSSGKVDANSLEKYRSPVPLFASGAEAAEHGMREVANPGASAKQAIRKLTSRRRER